MYYEARVHEIYEVQNAEHAAQLIKSGTMHSCQVPCWISADGVYKMFAVPDGHIDNPLLELAILRKHIADTNVPMHHFNRLNQLLTDGLTPLMHYLYTY